MLNYVLDIVEKFINSSVIENDWYILIPASEENEIKQALNEYIHTNGRWLKVDYDIQPLMNDTHCVLRIY